MSVATLCVRSGHFTCALDLAHVIETMRPLPAQPIRGAPDFILGLTRLRGEACPVIDLATLLCGGHHWPITRYVSLRAGTSRAALAVEAVLGVYAMDPGKLQMLPSILGEARQGAAAGLGVFRSELMLALNSAKLLQGDCWPVAAANGVAP